MTRTPSGMTIGEAGRRSGCTPATIRFYEEIGLLREVGRGSNGRRVYGWPDVSRLTFIRRSRDLGFPVDQVRRLLQAADARDPDCLAVRDLALEQIDALRARRAELDALEASLTSLAATCTNACAAARAPDCSIVASLASG